MSTSGQQIACAIVGARFRPPAAGLLSVLGAGSALTVRREPSNAYDPNALQVLVSSKELAKLAEPQLQSAVDGFGTNAEEVLRVSEWHLGYVPRSEAGEIAGAFDNANMLEVSGALTFDLQGRPSVSFIVP